MKHAFEAIWFCTGLFRTLTFGLKQMDFLNTFLSGVNKLVTLDAIGLPSDYVSFLKQFLGGISLFISRNIF